jgi:LysR family glycine cleavage system transcriptional activator
MSLPLLRLHSLDLLRGFVAAGRRMSMTQAAEDLCLTQSAISKQIRALEDMVGARLFKRSHRTIAFTPEGERLFRAADIALQQLQDAMGALVERRSPRPVTITASIGVAGLWLLPRLGNFQKKHPHADVRVAANNAVMDLRAEGVDLAIRYCTAQAAPKGALRLFGDTIAPVASPQLGIRSAPARDCPPATCSNSTTCAGRGCCGRPGCPRSAWSGRPTRGCCASTSTTR